MTKNKRIFVIRHGESIWNVLYRQHPNEEERYHPRMWTIDCDITDVGMQQAKEAGTKLYQEISSIDLVLVSPLRRAIQTAQLVLENYVGKTGKIEICKEAREVLVDACDIGSTPQALSKEFPDWDFTNLEEHWWYGGQTPDATLELLKLRQGREQGDDIEQRIRQLKLLLREREEKTIVVVCHSDTIWWLTRQLNKDGEQFGIKTDNGEIFEVTNFVLDEK